MHVVVESVSPGWVRRVLDAVTRHAGDVHAADVDGLRRALAGAHRWEGCPTANSVFAAAGPACYRRFSLKPAAGLASDCTVLLIAWPGGHATPIHDHDGLWGVETVLDGNLRVESFRVMPEPVLDVQPQDVATLGAGDDAAFVARDFAHCCINPSAQAPALTLHVYGGALDAYHAYRCDDGGRWSSVPQHAVSEQMSA